MDGRVGAIRKALDQHGFPLTPIFAYSAKYASGFYDSFREAADCAPQFGNRKAYQMNINGILQGALPRPRRRAYLMRICMYAFLTTAR
jgi:porphobilinogen synthase